MTPKVNRRKEIIKIIVEINNRLKATEKINEAKSWLFERINKIDKPKDSPRKRERRLK